MMIQNAVVFVTMLAAVQGFEPKCESMFATVLSPDCRVLYQCVQGRPVPMPACPSDLVFSRTYKVCVTQGSIYDDCKDSEQGKTSQVR